MNVNTAQPKLLAIDLECRYPHSEDGQLMEKLLTSEHLEVNEGTLSNALKSPQTSQHPPCSSLSAVTAESNNIAIVECPPKDKKKTSNGKLHSCKESTQTTRFSQTLDLGSTSDEKILGHYWSSQAKDLSKKLWLPIETDSVALHSNCLNGSFKSIQSNSWFSMKVWEPQARQSLQKTCSQSLTFSTVVSMADESTGAKKKEQKMKPPKMTKPKNPQPNSCRKILLKPPPEAKSVLKQWFGSVRQTYNWALSCIKKKPKEYKCVDVPWLRKRFVNKINIPKKMSYLLDTPKALRDSALFDLTEAYKVNIRKRKHDPSFKFELKFRSKKEDQAITISKETIKLILTEDGQNNEICMFPTFLKNKLKFHFRSRNREKSKDEMRVIAHDCKLLYDRLGRFFLAVPRHVQACESQASVNKQINKSCKKEWVAGDPGVRAFWTFYSPTDGVAYKIGEKDITRISRLCIHVDKLISKMANASTKAKQRKHMKKARVRLQNHIRNLVKEVHWKTINFLLNTFDNIIVPPFKTSGMVKWSKKRCINSKTARNMMCWSHYAFRQRLLQKAALVGVNVHVLGEEYTTKTCTNCMFINRKVAGEKVLVCPKCKVKVDRDLSGARNIFLKNISASS